jgi:PAS domain S-box-containing protein
MEMKNSLSAYRKHVQRRIKALRPVFSRAVLGDFSKNVKLYRKEDEFSEVYVGVQMMLEVIQEKISELTAVNKDLEEKLHALEALNLQLAQEKARAESLLESIGEGVIALDKNERILHANPAAASMLYGRPEDLIGKSAFVALRLADEKGRTIKRTERPLTRSLAANAPVTETRYSIVRKDGSLLPVVITAAPILLNGKMSGTIDVFRDVTKERQIDRAKSEFVSLASHQLRTPLTTMKWATGALLAGGLGDLNERQEKYLNRSEDAVARMLRLVEALLNVSRIELGKLIARPQPVDLCAMIEDLLEELHMQAKSRKVRLVRSCPTKPLIVRGDPKVLPIALHNIVSNAIKYSKRGRRVRVRLVRKGSTAELSVRDRGVGIPQNQQDRVFTKLFRADNVRTMYTEGTGLGLYIAKAIIEELGGTTSFTSTENVGTTFFITLPVDRSKRR